jgi:hypothetical protein
MNKTNIFNFKTSWAVKILALIFFIDTLGENIGLRIIFMSAILIGIIFLISWVKYLISLWIFYESLGGLSLLASNDVFTGELALAEALLILICLIFSWKEFTQGKIIIIERVEKMIGRVEKKKIVTIVLLLVGVAFMIAGHLTIFSWLQWVGIIVFFIGLSMRDIK